MRRLRILIVAAVVCALLTPTGAAFATGTIRDAWLDQYPEACTELVQAAGSCVLCHGDGFALNPYGVDLADNGLNFVAIEPIDSDGDSRTNGEEINIDCTLPGDPASVPADPQTWSQLKATYR